MLNEVRYHKVEVYLYSNRVVGKCFDDHVLLLANDQQSHHQMEASAASLPFKNKYQSIFSFHSKAFASHNFIVCHMMFRVVYIDLSRQPNGVGKIYLVSTRIVCVCL